MPVTSSSSTSAWWSYSAASVHPSARCAARWASQVWLAFVGQAASDQGIADTQGILYRGAGFDVVWPQFAALAGEFLDEPIQARKDAAAEYGRSRYHQADDEWSADWDLRGMAEDLQVLFWIGRDLANSRDWPGWKAGSEFGPVRERSDASRR